MSTTTVTIHGKLYENNDGKTARQVTNAQVTDVYTSESGPKAEVSVNEDGIALFKFGLVTGPVGPTGAGGASGYVGPTGATGPVGPTGAVGPTGEGFAIYKTYDSIENMNADAANVPAGKFVMIASTPEDPDNAKLYVKNSEGTFTFQTDMSGAQGIKGETGPVGPTGAQGDPNPKATGVADGFTIDKSVESDFDFGSLDPDE